MDYRVHFLFSDVVNQSMETRDGTVSRMMISRLDRIRTSKHGIDTVTPLSVEKPQVNYHTAWTNDDPFPDLSLLDPIVLYQHDEIRNAVDGIKKTAANSGLPTKYRKELLDFFDKHLYVLQTAFYSGPTA